MPLRRRHGVRRTADGGVRVTIAVHERDVLASLPEQLLAVVEGESDSALVAAIRERLFPRAYEDDQLEAEYQALVGDDLAAQRITALRAFSDSLTRGSSSGDSWSVELDADDAQAWLSVANDARLTFAQAASIRTEADWERPVDPTDAVVVLLHYLGWLEDELVRALTSALET